MKKLQPLALLCAFFLCAAVCTSCTTLTALSGMGGYSNAGAATAGMAGQFNVRLVECIGHSSLQSVTAVMAVTNTGPNAYVFIGGSLDRSLAVDNYGITSKPYSTAGKQYDLPSGVVVRVEIDRIEPVRPGTTMFQMLRISFGTSQRSIAFRNVPITWVN